MAMSQAKVELTESFMAKLPEEPGEGWHARARRAARERVMRAGFPVPRDEYWRYTRPEGYTNEAAAFMTAAAPADAFGGVDAVTLTFVDGVFDPEQSDALELAGATIELTTVAQQADLHWAQDVYGELEAAAQSPVERPLAALTTQIAFDGVLVHVTGKAEKPLRIRYGSNGGQMSLHHMIKLDPGASITVLEEGLPGARSGINMEVLVADEAQFHHIRLQGPEAEKQAMTGLFTRLGRESVFKSFTLSANGALSRNEAVIELTGDDAHATVGGAATGSGDFHHDDTVFITHDAVNCESRQVFKKVLRNGAKGVFQGKILVKVDAQKTDGYQISQGLMLDDESQFLAKPELEIYADDVACSHGSTVGAVDATALFYLTSRGVPKALAQKMLVQAFLAEALDEIEDEDLRDVVGELLADWLD